MTIPWTREAAAHLYRRAGFGGTPAEIDALFARGLEGAVGWLVDYDSIPTDDYESQLASRGYNLQRTTGLQQWFLDRMAFSPRPLEEKMTYFWNLHWTSGISKVKGETLILNQNQTERRLAMGRFDDLVTAISQAPAMLVWLDNATNRVGRPNENYGRELMELFTLGVGNYSQTDVTEVARALTGWTVANYNKATQYDAATFTVRADYHDDGVKTILGQSGAFDGGDAIRIILEHTDAEGSVSGRFIGAKLWSYFAGRDADDYVTAALRDVYVSSGRSIREVVRAILLHPELYEAHTMRTWVRSPVEFAVAAIRMLEAKSDFSAPANALAGMGQSLFNPSDAKGWDWGMAWLNTGSLFARASLANTLASNRGTAGSRFDASALLGGADASTAEGVVDALAARLNVEDAAGGVRDAWIAYLEANDDGSRGTWANDTAHVDEKVRGLVHVMLTGPAFQLA
ncbi:MAG TPA: DUF1800 domain-containing protein [Thermoanaerobaculia bacterium]|nr:DUF1800 domain-containing protein [Thermoanaerobaculia bacterium]